MQLQETISEEMGAHRNRNAGLGRREAGEMDKQALHGGLDSVMVGPSGRKR